MFHVYSVIYSGCIPCLINPLFFQPTPSHVSFMSLSYGKWLMSGWIILTYLIKKWWNLQFANRSRKPEGKPYCIIAILYILLYLYNIILKYIENLDLFKEFPKKWNIFPIYIYKIDSPVVVDFPLWKSAKSPLKSPRNHHYWSLLITSNHCR